MASAYDRCCYAQCLWWDALNLMYCRAKFFEAVKLNDTAAVLAQLENGVDVNAADIMDACADRGFGKRPDD